MMSVTVQGESAFRFGTPVRLFPTTRYYTSPPWQTFDASPDGERFLIIQEQPGKNEIGEEWAGGVKLRA